MNMDMSDVRRIAGGILENSDRIAYAKRGSAGQLHQVAYTLVDETTPHFEHFSDAYFADALWRELILGLAGLPQPTCAVFKWVTLISTVHFCSAVTLEKDGDSYLHLTFAGEHSLSFKHSDHAKCLQDEKVIRKLYGDGVRPPSLC